MREVPKKNYLILLLIFTLVILTTLLLVRIYNTRYRKTSIMYQYLQTINIKDLDTYLLEKPNTIVYMSDKYIKNNDIQEKKLKKIITNLNVNEYFVYLDLNEAKKNTIEKINKKYNGKLTQQLPVIIIFEEGKIKAAYYNLDKIDLETIIGDIK